MQRREVVAALGEVVEFRPPETNCICKSHIKFPKRFTGIQMEQTERCSSDISLHVLQFGSESNPILVMLTNISQISGN